MRELCAQATINVTRRRVLCKLKSSEKIEKREPWCDTRNNTHF